MMALQNDMGDCAICLNEMKSEVNRQKIALFGCHPLHGLHENCYNLWREKN